MDTFKNDAVKKRIKTLNTTQILGQLDQWRDKAAYYYKHDKYVHEKCLKNIAYFSSVLDRKLSG